MSNERPNVVAPRPVRIANSFFSKDDLKVSFYADIADIADKHSPEQPRSALQTEALEEFLSILRPSFLRKPRSLTTRPRHRLDVTSDHHNLDPRDRTTPLDSQEIHLEPDARWFSSSILSSPISRMHTRNPFLRNSDNRSPAPIAPLTPLTPAAIPLPLPTPDELVDSS
ncbi:hypothetical protein BYT27DRAFT_7178063 [Phlegmacium glaucopus]|nr:hypothetical protein BYT27DRAFT_7178063 [Phlegmacium glaucopus]